MKKFIVLFFISLLLVTATPAMAQFSLPIPIPTVPIPIPEIPTPQLPIPDITKLIEGDPPISTSFADTRQQSTLPDNFKPQKFQRLTQLPRGAKGGFLLRPGAFELAVESYCLRAGTHGPSQGNGYLYAPLKGSKAGLIEQILQNSVRHPEIPQKDIQMLLWAIIARTKISDTNAEIQQTAAKLLTKDEIFQLNGGALGLIPKSVLDKATANLPSPLRLVFETEARIREMLTIKSTSYTQLEQIAVLAGEPQRDGPEIPEGRWSLNPQGFYIRYLPTSYSKTLIQIYVPENFRKQANANVNLAAKSTKQALLLTQDGGAEYNPAGEVAVPGDTGRQRLGLSARPADGGTPDAGNDAGNDPGNDASGTSGTGNNANGASGTGNDTSSQPDSSAPRTGNTLTPTPKAPSKLEIFCNPVVRQSLEQDWQGTQADNRERLRWVLWNSTTGKLSVTNVTVGDPISGSVASGNTPPDENGVYVVGIYHTHPPKNLDPEPGSVQVRGPSPFNDIVHADTRKVPSLVRDYTDNNLTTVVDYLYGPNKRGEAQPGGDVMTNVNQLPLGTCGS
ncbi:hypothetical protein H6G64_25865 [Calothrix sp. FACHB-156]|nr:hypothetical protein [Calothrix sp. FACHB-156]